MSRNLYKLGTKLKDYILPGNICLVFFSAFFLYLMRRLQMSVFMENTFMVLSFPIFPFVVCNNLSFTIYTYRAMVCSLKSMEPTPPPHPHSQVVLHGQGFTASTILEQTCAFCTYVYECPVLVALDTVCSFQPILN